MKVEELIKQLKKAEPDNEVRICSGLGKDYTKHLYLSFDDVNDVLIYEIEGEEDKKNNVKVSKIQEFKIKVRKLFDDKNIDSLTTSRMEDLMEMFPGEDKKWT